jgi:hypothetical protein
MAPNLSAKKLIKNIDDALTLNLITDDFSFFPLFLSLINRIYLYFLKRNKK